MLQEVGQPGLDVVKLIESVGFPIVVAGYLLIRLDRRLRGLELAIVGLSHQLEQLNGPVRTRPESLGVLTDPPP